MTKLRIVDISAYQSHYKFGSTNENGLIVKATESTDYTNPFLKGQIEPVIKAGKPCGLYHYATTDTTPERQAQYFYNTCKHYFKFNNVIAVLDYEVSQSIATNFIKRFVNKFKSLTGGVCWVYGSVNVIEGASINNSPFWLSYYPFASTAVTPANWEEPNLPIKIDYPVSMWQYTTSGDKLDRSFFYGDFKTWQKLSVKGVK